jgi:hypothetical protein
MQTYNIVEHPEVALNVLQHRHAESCLANFIEGLRDN